MRKDIKREAFTAEEIEIARKMWKDGKTYTEIGAKLGRTNNSVSGFMGRNRDKFPERFGNLMKKNKSARSLPQLEVKSADKAARLSSNKIRQIFHEALNPSPPPKPKEQWSEYDQSRMPGVSLVGLDTRKCCRWPILDTFKGQEQMFCGEVKAGKNYCSEHQARSFRLA